MHGHLVIKGGLASTHRAHLALPIDDEAHHQG